MEVSTPAPQGAPRAPDKGWGATVVTTIALQWLVVVVFALVAGLIWDLQEALSLFGGGAAVALPNAGLALWLSLRRMRAGGFGVVAVMAGELIKLVLTISLLVILIVNLKPALSLLAVVVGVVVAIKAHWLAVWVTRDF